jgi:hypothetical protein
MAVGCVVRPIREELLLVEARVGLVVVERD